jgi:hypothetical protein
LPARRAQRFALAKTLPVFIRVPKSSLPSLEIPGVSGENNRCNDGQQEQDSELTGFLVSSDSCLPFVCALAQSVLENSVPAGNTSLIDASNAGLTVGESGEGRPLLTVFSDGPDTSSFLNGAAVLDAAKRGHYTKSR